MMGGAGPAYARAALGQLVDRAELGFAAVCAVGGGFLAGMNAALLWAVPASEPAAWKVGVALALAAAGCAKLLWRKS